MKQMINQINLQGYVFSTQNIFHNVTSAESKIPNTEYINGSINVATDDEGANVIPVRFNFVTEKYGKSGKENPAWAVLNDIENGNKTWDAQGKDGAYKIRLTCTASSNPFVSTVDGKMVDRPCINVSFAHPANNGFNDDMRNTFKFDMIVVNYAVREVENGDDYGVINGYVFDSYRKEATPVSLTIRDKAGMNYFEGLDASTANPVGLNCWGNIVSTTVRKENVVESDWGEPQVTYTTSTQREWLVVGGTTNGCEFGDDMFITEDEFIECLNNHENTIAAAQARYDAKKNAESDFGVTQNNAPKRTFGSTNDFKF